MLSLICWSPCLYFLYVFNFTLCDLGYCCHEVWQVHEFKITKGIQNIGTKKIREAVLNHWVIKALTKRSSERSTYRRCMNTVPSISGLEPGLWLALHYYLDIPTVTASVPAAYSHRSLPTCIYIQINVTATSSISEHRWRGTIIHGLTSYHNLLLRFRGQYVL